MQTSDPSSLPDSQTPEPAAYRPGFMRGILLPLIRTGLVAVIALALIKIAFFSTAAADDEQVPEATFAEPTVMATIATIRNEVSLTGTVLPDEATPVRATAAGTISRVLVTNGQMVASGEPLYRVTSEVEVPTAEGEEPVPPRSSTVVVRSPAAGALAGFSVLEGQSVEIGTETGSVAPPSFHIEAPLTAREQYRLTTQPTEAAVTIEGGPAPFTCSGVQIVQANASTTGSGESEPATGQSTGQAMVRCAVPSDVRAFSGLVAQLTLSVGVAENALTLPTTAVLGSADTGIVYRSDPGGGDPVEVSVKLGISDGTTVQIIEGLAEGDEVLEFVPGAAAQDDCSDPETADPQMCDEAVMMG